MSEVDLKYILDISGVTVGAVLEIGGETEGPGVDFWVGLTKGSKVGSFNDSAVGDICVIS